MISLITCSSNLNLVDLLRGDLDERVHKKKTRTAKVFTKGNDGKIT